MPNKNTLQQLCFAHNRGTHKWKLKPPVHWSCTNLQIPVSFYGRVLASKPFALVLSPPGLPVRLLHVQRHQRFISFLLRLSPASVGGHLPKPAGLGWTCCSQGELPREGGAQPKNRWQKRFLDGNDDMEKLINCNKAEQSSLHADYHSKPTFHTTSRVIFRSKILNLGINNVKLLHSLSLCFTKLCFPSPSRRNLACLTLNLLQVPWKHLNNKNAHQNLNFLQLCQRQWNFYWIPEPSFSTQSWAGEEAWARQGPEPLGPCFPFPAISSSIPAPITLPPNKSQQEFSIHPGNGCCEQYRAPPGFRDVYSGYMWWI